jgi:hypothetical protein
MRWLALLLKHLSEEELTLGKFRAKGIVALVLGLALAWFVATGGLANVPNAIAKGLSSISALLKYNHLGTGAAHIADPPEK